MCFTIPKKIKSIDGQTAVLETGDQVDISLLENCQAGDFVQVNAGVAVSKMSQKEAQATRLFIKENI